MRIKIIEKDISSARLYPYAKLLLVAIRDLVGHEDFIEYFDFKNFMDFQTMEELADVGKALFFLRNKGFIELLI